MPDPIPAGRVLQLRRGTTQGNQIFTGAPGEVTMDTDKNILILHDGVVAGGYPHQLQNTSYTRKSYASFRAAVTQGTVACLGFSSPVNAPLPIVVNVGGIITGVAAFEMGVEQSVQDHFSIPPDWTAPIDLEIVWRSLATTGNVQWFIQTLSVSSGNTIENSIWNPRDYIVDATNATSEGLTTTILENINCTNVTSDSELFFSFGRTTVDTLIANAELLSLRFVVRRLGV